MTNHKTDLTADADADTLFSLCRCGCASVDLKLTEVAVLNPPPPWSADIGFLGLIEAGATRQPLPCRTASGL